MLADLFLTLSLVYLLKLLPFCENVLNAHLSRDLLFNSLTLRDNKSDLPVRLLGQHSRKLLRRLCLQNLFLALHAQLIHHRPGCLVRLLCRRNRFLRLHC